MPNLARHLRRWATPLRRTPLHPQWLCSRHDGELISWIRSIRPGSTVLDVGCASQWTRSVLHQRCRYVALDVPATAQWYDGTKPAIYADAHAIPLSDSSVDVVLALDILEHLRDPERAVAEFHRVLTDGGHVIVQIPFLYPIHDAPHDHTRWTIHGHRSMARRHSFAVERESPLGETIETAALIINLALCKSAIDGVRKPRLIGLLTPVLPLLVLAINLIAYTLTKLAPRGDFMHFSCRSIWVKRSD